MVSSMRMVIKKKTPPSNTEGSLISEEEPQLIV
jgi:hypothetical protein